MQPASNHNKKNRVIPLLQPPGATTRARHALLAGQAVSLTLYDHTVIEGKLLEFNKKNETIRFMPTAAKSAETIEFNRFRALFSRKNFPFQAKKKEVTRDNQASPFEVCINQDEPVRGMTFGSRNDDLGLYLYPTSDEKTFSYAFFPGKIRSKKIDKTNQCLHIEIDLKAASGPAKDRNRIEPICGFDNLIEALEHPNPSLSGARLGNILVSSGLIKQAQLEEALATQAASQEKTYIGEILMEKGLIDEDDLNRALALELGIPFVDLASLEPDTESLGMIPEDIVRKYHLIPVGRHRHRLIVAMRNPLDWEALNTIRFQCNLGIEQVVATPGEINRLISVYFASNLEEAIEDEYAGTVSDDDDGNVDMAAISDNVTVKLVNRIIIDAHQQGASDIHIEPAPGAAKTLVRFRKDGVLQTYHEIPAGVRNAVIARLKIMANLDTSERRKPQDGKINFSKYGPLKIELRVATIPTAANQEDMVLRLLTSGDPIPLRQLGLSHENQDMLMKLISQPYGLFFVCGPTGSGKSTTLHSILGQINTPERKIWTAEDPVEVTQKGLRQVQVNPRIGLTFASAMRAFLRADPDVIMVGEMRDEETVKIGIEASLTGHLVFSTLHTNTAVDSIARLLDMGMEPFNFSDALLGVLAQRLCRRLCKHCRQEHVLTESELLALAQEYCQDLVTSEADSDQRTAIEAMVMQDWRRRHGNEEGLVCLYEASSCVRCEDTGYRGRIAITELLEATDEIKTMIINRTPAKEILHHALNEGMRTLRQDGIEKALMGITDMASVRAVCIR